MPGYSYPASLVNQFEIFIDSNYVPNEHEDVDQYGSFAIPSKIMLYQSHPESLVKQNEILIELSC